MKRIRKEHSKIFAKEWSTPEESRLETMGRLLMRELRSIRLKIINI